MKCGFVSWALIMCKLVRFIKEMVIIKTTFGQLEKLKINGKRKNEVAKSLCLEYISAKILYSFVGYFCQFVCNFAPSKARLHVAATCTLGNMVICGNQI